MTDNDILNAFSRILGDLLDDESIRLTSTTRRQDVPGWDSLAYVNFIVAVELEFGVKFRIADVESYATVGEIVSGLQSLLR